MPTAELEEAPVKETVVKPVEEKAKPEPKIPTDLLQLFVGPVVNLYKIDQHKVSYSKYRINVWTRKVEENAVVPRFNLVESYYVDYSTSTGVIKDETDRRVISLEGGVCDASETNSCRC
jgi:hypothetical protein